MSAEDIRKTHAAADEWEDSDHSGYADDEWHRHSSDEHPQHAHGETTPGMITVVGLVSFALLVAMIAGVWIYFLQALKVEYAAKRDMWLGAEVSMMKDTWDQRWREYAWVDPAKGTIRVPIERGIEMAASAYAQNAK